MKHENLDDKMTTVITCKNCGTSFLGNYCNQCGQRADTRRLDAKTIVHDLFHAVTHVEKGYFHSFKQMFVRPGHSIREYLQGKRAEHSNPFLMLIIIGALAAFLFDKFNVSTLNSINIHNMHENRQVLTSKYFALLALVYSFIFAFVDYIIFRYKNYYYAELFVFNIFQLLVTMTMNLVLLPLWILLGTSAAGDYARIAVYLLILIYVIFVRYQFFNVKGDKKAFRRWLVEIVVFLCLVLVIGRRTISHIF